MLGQEELERYFPERKMRMFVGTWNMCEMKNIPASLDDFVLPESSEFVQDLYVIGSQESVGNRLVSSAACCQTYTIFDVFYFCSRV